MNPFQSIDMHNIYSDLMKVFISHGHYPYIVTPREKQTGEKTELMDCGNHAILKVRIGNTSNVSFVEKGISTVLLEYQFNKAINKYLGNIKFDLILYSTPPITLAGVVRKLKKKYNAKTYLMLKDIFPQNAIDMGLFSARSPIAQYFKWKEKSFYKISDKIGCMSQANVDFVLKQNLYLTKDKVEILPNAILLNPTFDRQSAKDAVRKQFSIPETAISVLFGGNLGKPQGIKFLVQCLKALKDREDFYFIFCGDGTDYHLLEKYRATENPKNFRLIKFLPKREYDKLARGCDIGLISLDYRFTIPNYPSRILSYMENSTPVLCTTDSNTDIGHLVEEYKFGYSCLSNSVLAFIECLEKFKNADLDYMGSMSRKACEKVFSVEECYNRIIDTCTDESL